LTKYCMLPVPKVMAVGEALTETTERSIWSFTVTAVLPLLFAGTGSPWSAAIDALSVLEPAAPGVTVIVTLTLEPEPWSAHLQVTTPADWPHVPPPVAVADTKVDDAGRFAVMTAF